jgi:beta-lactamase superfamily II metal-dependent hydrolase
MLSFHVLNVGHGSSTVVEFRAENGIVFGLIDSAANSGESPKALRKLQELGATNLSFICLTHPHSDHFRGLYDVIRTFDPQIGSFYTGPMGDLLNNQGRLKRYGLQLEKLRQRTDGTKQTIALLEFMQLLMWASSGRCDWTECAGEENRLGPDGFNGVEVWTLVPPRAVKGDIIGWIERGDPRVFGHEDLNDLSLAVLFKYAGVQVLVGGDATAKNWKARRKFEANTAPLDCKAVVIPHHGSRGDNPDDVLTQIFSNNGERFGINTANGHSHPSIEVIEWMEANTIEPYCTNLIPSCGAKIIALQPFPDLDPALASILRQSVLDPMLVQPCQGDITITITPAGDLSIAPQFNAICGFRRQWKSLFEAN